MASNVYLARDCAAVRSYSIRPDKRRHLHHFSRASLSLLLESEKLQVADVILRNAPLASLDIPVSSGVAALILLGGVRSLFALGSIFGRTYSQTVVCRRGAR